MAKAKGSRGQRGKARSTAARRPAGISSQLARRLRELCESIDEELEESGEKGCTVHITDCVISPQDPNNVLLTFPRGVKVDVDRLKSFVETITREFGPGTEHPPHPEPRGPGKPGSGNG